MKIQVVGSFFLIACLLTGCADSEKLESAPPNALFCKNITENVQTIQHLHLPATPEKQFESPVPVLVESVPVRQPLRKAVQLTVPHGGKNNATGWCKPCTTLSNRQIQRYYLESVRIKGCICSRVKIIVNLYAINFILRDEFADTIGNQLSNLWIGRIQPPAVTAFYQPSSTLCFICIPL